MGEPINVEELAKRLLKHLGAKNLEISYIGVKPGEKLHEDLFSNFENAAIDDLGLILNTKRMFQVSNLEGLSSPTDDLEAAEIIDKLISMAFPAPVQ
jgi:FlaA1/EpsC-like NDP-sugar epimerase